MKIPTFEDLMLPLLKYIYDGNIHNNKECEKSLSKELKLTKEQLDERLSSGKRIFYDRLLWAKTYLKKAGLIESTEKRGSFKITNEGKKLVESDPLYIDSKYLRRYPKFIDYINKNNKYNKKEEFYTIKTPIEELELSYNEINKSLKEELLDKLKKVDFYKFESIVVDLIIRMGYGGTKSDINNSITKKSNDEGIDGIINQDILGLDSIYIQAKRYKENSISRPSIQSFVGALEGKGAVKGIFITTSNFSKGAIDYVSNLQNKKLVLIDGYKLCELMIEFNVGVSTEVTYEVKRIDSDYFLDE